MAEHRPAHRRCVAVAVAVTALMGSATIAPANASATTRLHCSASVSTSHPKQYSYLYVNVRANARDATVHTTANYKSTKTSHGGHTNSTGRAAVKYYISRATKGYKVKVGVTVTSGHQRTACSTSFTPR